MTRQQVAQRLGKSLATVRRIEGTLLHPTRDAHGQYRFDDDEVEDVARRIENGEITVWQELRASSTSATSDALGPAFGRAACGHCEARQRQVRQISDELDQLRHEHSRELGVLRLAGNPAGRIRQGKLIDFEEQFVLHRSYTGLPLYNSDAHRRLVSRLALSEIADNVAIRDSSKVQIFISDLRGLLELSGTAERETLLLIQHKILVYLSAVVLATVQEISPQDKLLFRLLKRHRAVIGDDIVADILKNFSQLYAIGTENPRQLVDFVKNIFERLTTASELVAAEYADWNEEATFPLFKTA